ncbi:MAG: hypothetical protein ACOC9J_03090, partial [Persicimonas sp.]
GLVFLIIEMALVPLLGASIWGPPRIMAAIVMGPQVLPPPATFDLAIFAVAMIVHFSLSIIYTALLGLFLRRQHVAVAGLIGAGFGLLLYLVNFFVFTGIFPWFAEARNWVSVVAHIAFGGVAGLSYVWLSTRLGERQRVRAEA